MPVEAVTASGKYTDEIISRNFVAISKAFDSIDGRLDMFDNWIKHLEGHIGELYQVAQTATKPKGIKTKYKILLGVTIGVYIGRKMMTDDFNRRMEKLKKETKEQFDNFLAEQKNSSESESVPGRI